MLIFIIVLVVIVSYSFITILYENKKLKKEYKVVYTDFRNVEFDRDIEDLALELINNHLRRYQKELKKELGKKEPSKKKISIILKLLNEQYNNIDLVVKDIVDIDTKSFDLKNVLNDLTNEVNKEYKNVNVKYSISNDLSKKLKCDINKLIAALRIIFLKSIENGANDINLEVSLSEPQNNKIKLSFKILNIDLFGNSKCIPDILKFMDISSITSKHVDSIIEPELLIIRQNLLYVAKSLKFETSNNSTNLLFDVYCLIN